MSSRLRQALSVVLVALVVIAAAGCTAETISGGSQTVTVKVTTGPTGIGRYESATWIVRKIQVLPADPATAALYGTNALILFFFPVDTNLAETQGESISNIAISPGTYRVSYIEITPLVLVDENVSSTPASCIEGLAVIDGSKPCHFNQTTQLCDSDVPPQFGFTNTPYTFTVSPGTTEIKMKINVPALIAGYESSYTCAPGCGPGGSPCLTAFSESTYRSAVLANISFE